MSGRQPIAAKRIQDEILDELVRQMNSELGLFAFHSDDLNGDRVIDCEGTLDLRRLAIAIAHLVNDH